MKYYLLLASHQYTDTKEKADKSGEPWQIDIWPDDKAKQMARLNDMLRQIHREPSISISPEPQSNEALAPPAVSAGAAPPPDPRKNSGPPQAAIVDAILEANPAQFGQILMATLDRLGELRAEGWDQLQAISKQHRSRKSLETGLGYIALEIGRPLAG